MSNSIYIIHLSDLHINPRDPAESKPVYRDLCQKLKKFKDQKRIDFSLLIISGDLVNQGAGDYRPVEKIVDELCFTSDLTRERIFLVPGNHDVVRDRCPGFIYNGVVSKLKRDPRNEFEKLDDEARNQFVPGFEAYSQFAQKFPLLNLNDFDLPGFAQADIELSGVKIRLCGLNTALVAGSDDQGKNDDQLRDRVLGRQILWRMLEDDERLPIVVSHYPLPWIHVDERKEVIERLQTSNAIFLHGHTHSPAADIQGVTRNHELLVLGVGSMYGERWSGRNHCQILELSSNNSSPLLHEWFWSGEYGWRAVEPLEINWSGWERFRQELGPPDPPPAHESGLINIGNGRRDDERVSYWHRSLELAADGSDLVILGRSLVDFSLLYRAIERSINEKKLNVKIGVLDENSLANSKIVRDNDENRSWIERPISTDWAMNDVPGSMERFRRIKVTPGTGSLEIYGLPFYLSHSFLAYTNSYDKHRYCLEEVGMALDKDRRPFLELKALSSDSYAASLETLYTSLMTTNRLLLRDDGQRSEKDTTQRAKIIAPKAERLGLVDLSVGQADVDWCVGGISEIIAKTPVDGEILIVGRSLVAWTRHHKQLADAIVKRRVTCIFVIADPTLRDLKSLAKDDYAEVDLPAIWKQFSENLYPILEQHEGEPMGLFELYGIPAYVPDTFASYTGPGRVRYCTLEPGIGVTPAERTILYFKQVSEKDIYTSLNKIYRGILKGREPLLRFPTR